MRASRRNEVVLEIERDERPRFVARRVVGLVGSVPRAGTPDERLREARELLLFLIGEEGEGMAVVEMLKPRDPIARLRPKADPEPD